MGANYHIIWTDKDGRHSISARTEDPQVAEDLLRRITEHIKRERFPWLAKPTDEPDPAIVAILAAARRRARRLKRKKKG